MLNSKTFSIAAMTFAVAGAALLSARHHQAIAQSGPLLVNVANIDIVPGNVDKFLAAIKENGEAAIKEPGCREFNVTVARNDPNHVLIFAVFDNAAALDAHRQTDAYKKFQTLTKGMVAKNNAGQYSSVAMNRKPM